MLLPDSYLMEPCVDPAHEVQAAGRIHRLGQSKDVLVKRFCYRASCALPPSLLLRSITHS
jgi:E3 ubiquitin-protein ligase SHPRH